MRVSVNSASLQLRGGRKRDHQEELNSRPQENISSDLLKDLSDLQLQGRSRALDGVTHVTGRGHAEASRLMDGVIISPLGLT